MKFTIQKVEAAKLERAYGILCQSLAKVRKTEDNTPFGMTYCVIEPGNATSPHHHYDGEYFLILSGRGEMQVGDERSEVTEGNLVQIPNHTSHVLKNLSDKEELHFVSVYWDKNAASSPQLKDDHLVISAPPTPNGKLHVGHLSGPYLAADVLKRYLRVRGKKAVARTGADENQTYVPFKGFQEDRSPEQVMNDYSASIQSILAKFGASPDAFLEPRHESGYAAFVQNFVETLKNKGAIKLKTVKAPFSLGLNRFVHEAYVSGGCPHCTLPTNANGCEACGLYNDAGDLVNPVCNVTQKPVELREVEKYYFDLAQYREKLLEAHARTAMTPDLRTYSRRLLEEGLGDISVTFPGEWGIPAPGLQGQIVYEWIEMAAAYLYHAQKSSRSGDYREFWSSSSADVVLSFGFDNSFFYMALVPALLWAFDESIKYPDGFLINQFYLLDGKKFSTSRKHAVWGDEILSPDLKDALRLYLAATRSEGRQTNFKLREVERNFSDLLAGEWDAYFANLETHLAPFKKDGLKSEWRLSDRDRAYLRDLEHSLTEAESYYHWKTFSLNRIARVAEAMVRSSQTYLMESLPYSQSPATAESWRASLLMCATGVKALSMLLAPIAPDYASELRTLIGLKGDITWENPLEPLKEIHPSSSKASGFGATALKALRSFLNTPAGAKYL